ncbi:hypothetical protein PTI98_011770 [Pleurotus ostreatus]|nr:hypothetical protein PTI98_011770 [Pleurotus ostreatus]
MLIILIINESTFHDTNNTKEEASDSSEPVLEYYDGDLDLDGASAPQSSPPEIETQQQGQRSPSPVQVAQGQRERRRTTPEKLGQAYTSANGVSNSNTIEDGNMDVDVIVISSSEGENHDGEDRPFYYKPPNSHRKKPKPKPKSTSKSRGNQDRDRRDTIMLVDTVPEATPPRGKVIFIDPDIIELSDTPAPPPAPCSRPSRPLPRPLRLSRRSPSLPPYESDASPPPCTPRTPHAPPPPRTPLFLPTPTPRSPPRVQLVRSAPQPFRARKSAYPPTYTPTPACHGASRANARFEHGQAARHVGKGQTEREERRRREKKEKKEKEKKLAGPNSQNRDRDRDAEANDVIELSDTPDAGVDDFDPDPDPDHAYDRDSDPDFAAFEDIVFAPRKRKRRPSHQQSPSPPMSALAATPSGVQARKTVPMKVSRAFTREQYAPNLNSGSWAPSARKSASAAGKTLERKRKFHPPYPLFMRFT